MDDFESSFKLSSCLKGYTKEQEKVLPPEETAKNVFARLSRMFDISHLTLTQRFDAVPGAYSFTCKSDQLAASGKGLSLEQSKASAVMEFAERYSWTHFDYKHYDGYVFTTFNELAKSTTHMIDEKYLFDNFFELENKKELIAETKNIPLHWIKGDSLTTHKKVYFPINWHNMVFGSNGLASGNSLEECILQGLCELIEREAIYRLLVDQIEGNDVDQKSITNKQIKQLIDNSKDAGITFVIKDISYDLGVPTFIVYGTSEKDVDGLCYQGAGQGTATNPEKALMRALSEYYENYSLIKHRELEAQEYAGMDVKKYYKNLPKRHYGFHITCNPEMLYKSAKTIRFDEVKSVSKDDIKDEVEYIIGTLAKLKYDVIVVDKTHVQLKVPAVRVLVPGMRTCIVNDFLDPSVPMLEVYYEAGNDEKSKEWFMHFVKGLKAFYLIENQVKQNLKMESVLDRDYLVNLAKFHKDRKQIIASYKDLVSIDGNLRDIVGK